MISDSTRIAIVPLPVKPTLKNTAKIIHRSRKQLKTARLHHHAQDQKLILTQISKRYISSVKQLIIRVQKFIASRNAIILQNFKKTVQ